jgi:HD-like signal output (HDOD) protein
VTMTPTLPSVGLYPSKAALETAFQVVRKAKVPQIPDVVLALKREVARPEPDLRAISDLVAKDIAITGQLLKTINSPLFNLRSKIGSVQQAVAILGVKRLANLVTAEAINRMLEATDGTVRVIWDSIMEEARVTVAVSRVVKAISEDEAYLFGIMHDVGCLIFGNTSTDYGAEWILRSNASPSALLNYEMTTMGVGHPTVGFLLAGHWQLPEHLALAIYHHHDHGYIEGEDQKVRSLIAMVKLAHHLVALSHGTHEMPEMMAYREDAWQELAIRENDWLELCAQAEQGAWNS